VDPEPDLSDSSEDEGEWTVRSECLVDYRNDTTRVDVANGDAVYALYKDEAGKWSTEFYKATVTEVGSGRVYIIVLFIF
jgi:hypothetical protein